MPPVFEPYLSWNRYSSFGRFFVSVEPARKAYAMIPIRSPSGVAKLIRKGAMLGVDA